MQPYPLPPALRRPGMTFICEVPSAEAGRGFLADLLMDRLDSGGWPTRDRAAPEEEC